MSGRLIGSLFALRVAGVSALALGATAAGAIGLLDGGFASASDAACVLAFMVALYGVPLLAVGSFATGLASLLRRVSRPAAASAVVAIAALACGVTALVLILSFWSNDSDVWLGLAESHRRGSRWLAGTGALVAPLVLVVAQWRPRWGFAVVAALFAIVAAGLAGEPAQRVPRPPARAERLVDAPPVLLIGVDGLSAELARAGLDAGRLPHLAALLERSASGSLETLRPTESASIWTTIATGVLPGRHGVRFFTETMLPGLVDPIQRMPKRLKLRRMLAAAEKIVPGVRTVPVGSGVRRVPAFWETMSEAGHEVAVVGWWASAPVDPVRGWLVSDRVGFFDWSIGRTATSTPTLEGGTVYPPDLGAVIAEDLVLPGQLDGQLLVDFSDGGQDGSAWQGEARWEHKNPASELRFSYALDASYRGIALRALEEMPELDCLAVYLRGVDILGHAALWASPLAEEPEVSAAERRRYGSLYERYLEWIDAVLGELLAAVGPEASVILISDHGFERVKPMRWAHPDAPAGVIAISGPEIRPGELDGARVVDVAPTLLFLTGLDVPEGLDGRALEELWSGASRPAARRGRPVPIDIDTAVTVSPEAGGDAVDRSMIDGLRALGYIE